MFFSPRSAVAASEPFGRMEEILLIVFFAALKHRSSTIRWTEVRRLGCRTHRLAA